MRVAAVQMCSTTSIRENCSAMEALPDLGEGDELWVRVYVYYPSGFTFRCGCTQGMKFLRIHTRSSSGNNEGYHSILVKGGETGGLYHISTEVMGNEFSPY